MQDEKKGSSENLAHVLSPYVLPATEYLNTKQAAAYMGLSRQRLEIWRCKGGGPEYVKLAQAVRYRRGTLDKFMADHTQRHTAEV